MFFVQYYPQMAVVPQRETIKKLISDVVSTVDSWNSLKPDDAISYIRRIERSCHNTAVTRAIDQGVSRTFNNKDFIDIYSECCGRIISHLDPNSFINSKTSHPTYFADLISSNAIDLNQIAQFDSASMQPESNAKIRNYINARKNVTQEKKTSQRFRCGNCGGTKTTYFSYQKKGSDEPETKNITCENEKCRNQWEMT